MKIAFLLCGICLCALVGGCAVAETDGNEVGAKFQRGMQGQGQLVPNNPTSDSFGSDYR